MTQFQQLALAAHLVGVILWIGGAVVSGSIAAYAVTTSGEGKKVALAGARKAVIYWATPGMLLAWLGGLWVLVPEFTTLYARAGWMHGKLTLLVVLTALTGVLTGRLRRAAAGTKDAPGGLLQGLAIALAIGGVIVVVLARLKPF